MICQVLRYFSDQAVLNLLVIMFAHFTQRRWRRDHDQLFKFIGQGATFQKLSRFDGKARFLQLVKIGLFHRTAVTSHGVECTTRRIGSLIAVIGIVLQSHPFSFQIWSHAISLVPKEKHLAPVGNQHHRIMIDPHRPVPFPASY